MTVCPVCTSKNTYKFLEQNNVPVHQHMIFKTTTAARMIARGDLAMNLCCDCNFVFNASFDPARLSYDQSYDNTQTCSVTFANYMDALAQEILAGVPQRPFTFIEIGCGKGDFLKHVMERAGVRATGYGFDPTYEGSENFYDGRLQFFKKFYNENCVDIAADIIICRHVIEHIQNPRILLMPIAKALRDSKQAKLYFETPNVKWIFKNQVILDFFYEHCALYSHRSLSLAIRNAGFNVDAVRDVFGGQYLWLQASTIHAPNNLPHEEDFLPLAQAYEKNYQSRLQHLQQTIFEQAQTGKVALWGAGAKGVTLANLIDPQAKIIDCIIDMNPAKQGGYLPGTGHPIVAPNMISERGINAAFVMNPNYLAEIRQKLKEDNISLALLAVD